MDFDVSFTSKKLTPWGGMIFLKEMLQKLGFRAQIEENQDLPQSGSNRGYKTLTIVEGFITRVWCGANQFLHTEVTRHDAALDRILDWKNTPGQDTYKRFFGKFNQATNQKVSDYLYQRVFNNFNFDNFPTDEVLEFLNYLLRKSPPQVLHLIPFWIGPEFRTYSGQKKSSRGKTSETCARDGGRTRTAVKPQDFKSCVSTNSTTQAV